MRSRGENYRPGRAGVIEAYTVAGAAVVLAGQPQVDYRGRISITHEVDLNKSSDNLPLRRVV